MPGRPRSMTPRDRFFEKCMATSGGCWLWTGSTARGYASFTSNGHKCRAARWAYEEFVGPIPDGMEVDHLCRNTLCVNPDHLEPVTHAQNCARARLTLCRAGLHDLTEPTNRHPSVRGCYACKKAGMRRRYAARG